MHPIDAFGLPAAGLLIVAAALQLAWAKARVAAAERRTHALRAIWLAQVWTDLEAR